MDVSYSGKRYSLSYNYKEKRIWFRLDTTEYTDLEEVLPKMLMTLYPNVLSSNLGDAKTKSRVHKDFASQEEIDRNKSDEFIDMVIRQNLSDIKKNKKPCGFNYLLHPKIIFPIIEEGKPLEFYLETHKSNVKRTEKWILVDRLSGILNNAGIGHEIVEDIAEKNIALLKEMEKII